MYNAEMHAFDVDKLLFFSSFPQLLVINWHLIHQRLIHSDLLSLQSHVCKKVNGMHQVKNKFAVSFVEDIFNFTNETKGGK